MKKLCLTVLSLCLYFSTIQAQDFDSAIGLRLGTPSSITYKKFISQSAALEGIASYRGLIGSSWVSLGAAYQIHNDIESIPQFQWYYGGGASVFFWSYSDNIFVDEASTSFGIQGYLGISYTLANTPINFSLDWVPNFFLNGFSSGLSGDRGSLAVRYVLGRSGGDK